VDRNAPCFRDPLSIGAVESVPPDVSRLTLCPPGEPPAGRRPEGRVGHEAESASEWHELSCDRWCVFIDLMSRRHVVRGRLCRLQCPAGTRAWMQ
jgi:hypothetical protein